ncbi:MAG: hypothetical protein V5A76_08605 [Candidatus Thermoplasmatota archaeon]
MPIIVSNEEETRKIEESKFEAETKLQEYIYDNPEILPIEEIEEDTPFIIAAREVPTNSGPIDAVGLDKNGNIYVIETKLYSNTDKRKVMAQVMDYGAALWKHTNDFGEFMKTLRNRYRNKFDKELDNELLSTFDIDEEEMEEYLEEVKQNLDDGKFRFVILMDQVTSRLKDLILFMNQNSRFDVYAVELDHYTFDDYKISIPKMYGAEVKKSVGSSSKRKNWDEESFFEDLKKKVDESDYEKVKKIYEETKELGEISYGTGYKKGSITLKVPSDDDVIASIYNIYSNGVMRFFKPYQLGENVEQELKEKYGPDLCEKNPDIPDYKNSPWKGKVNQIEEDQVEDFIQFYRDVVEEIKELKVKKQ